MGGTKENSGFSGPVGRQASAGQIPAFVGPAHHIQGGRRGRGGVWEGLLYSSIIALLSSHFHPFGSRIPIRKRIRRT